jgi:hypothetical protein
VSDYLGEELATDVDYTAGIIPGTTQQADPAAPGVAGSAGMAIGTGTGQHGSVLLEPGEGGMSGAVQRVYDWLRAPLIGDASPTDVFWMVGVVIVAVIAWNLVLYHIRIAAEAV